MIWRKAWWECRVGVYLIFPFPLLFGLFAPFLSDKVQGGPWNFYAGLVVVFSSLVALLMATPFLQSQYSGQILTGCHPSMYFQLSMPVSRRRMLLARAITGALLTVVFIFLSLALFATTAPLRGLHIGMAQIFGRTVFISLAVLAQFALATFVMTIFDQTIGLLISGGIGGAVLGLSAVVKLFGGHFAPLAFADGQHFAETGEVVWPAVAAVLGLTIALLVATAYLVERKEY